MLWAKLTAGTKVVLTVIAKKSLCSPTMLIICLAHSTTERDLHILHTCTFHYNTPLVYGLAVSI